MRQRRSATRLNRLLADTGRQMPVIAAVTPLSDPGLAAAGDCLRGMDQGNLDACDLMIVRFGRAGRVAGDEALDAILALPAADIVTAAKLTGKAGQSSEAAARVGQSTVRIVFLGVGDRSPRALRRAGGEIGRMLQPGDRAVSSVVAGQPALQVQAFAEGVLLGSYRYSEKSTATGAAAKEAGDASEAEVRLLVTWAARDELAATIEEASTIATAVALAREPTQNPAVRKTPAKVAHVARPVAAETGPAARVWSEQEISSAGFCGL